MVDEVSIRSRRAPPEPPVRRAKHIPQEGTKQFALLRALLQGATVDPIYAVAELNLPTANARASELRRMGWPIRDTQVPHPKLEREVMTAYFFDTHFRAWMAANMDKHPSEYPYKEGRGKFSEWSPDDFAKAAKPD